MIDKSARDEIARHYGAFAIGGSLDDMYEAERGHCYDFADRLIAALDDGGFAVVRKVATGNMLVAGGNAQQKSIGSWGEPGVVWSAMLAASNPKEEGSDN